MKVLVVFSHPVAESFARALLDRCVADLNDAGHEVTVKDLYAESFRPILSAEERRDYEDVAHNRKAIAAEVAALEAAQGLLLIYPTWWYGMPAMLKGWFDRVWIPGVAFGLDPQRGISIHTLRQIDRLMVVTTYGAPRWFIRLWMGDPGRKVVLRGLKPLLARGCRASWSALYAMDTATSDQRGRFLEDVSRKLALFSR
ncbi:MAG TPA: NAD(P)H-dependent oxidoreductase [Phenylobacterium sp.]|uniref:NAD(P)H-dependent oxidoreductase n=1 Tax=Phenylobacterium sp. TaxID=1871053 RepID=UPI002B467C5E|nr:NAD(P)H-dependent oxidoreductase [Phenylobacterium sp.]HKR90160.1 NAD(P)H-dependent oxidoreductase [Phenylobacterium sp.]